MRVDSSKKHVDRNNLLLFSYLASLQAVHPSGYGSCVLFVQCTVADIQPDLACLTLTGHHAELDS